MPDAPIAYDVAEVDGVRFSWRLGCRGHPQPPPAFSLLADALRDVDGPLLDAAGCMGVAARAATRADARILEASATALDAIGRDLTESAADRPGASRALSLQAGLPWDLPAGSVQRLVLAPPSDRGTARVLAELDAAAHALERDGEVWLVLEKDRGAKRYEREAARRFRGGAIVARSRGARLSRWHGTEANVPAPDPWLSFEVDGRATVALAGVYAAGKLDPGTRLLLRTLHDREALRPHDAVLDLGCGWGPLARAATEAGARVTAVDDDLAAVRSCRANVPTAEVRHADAVTMPDDGARYRRVLVNPPFHVGKAVRNALAVAMLQAGRRRLAADGELWWVANRDLRHERAEGLQGAEEIADEGGFRVMRLRARSSR